MEINQFKKVLLIRSIIYASIIGLLVGGVLWLDMSKTKYQQESDKINNEINNLQNKLSSLNKKTLAFSEAVKTWERLPQEKKKLSGLRITESKDLIDLYGQNLNLTNIKTSFSKPEEARKELLKEFIKTISSKINISFNSMSDEEVFSFIEKINDRFPGYIQFTNLTMTRNKNITKEILEAISKGERPTLVSSKIDFGWKDMKYSPPSK